MNENQSQTLVLFKFKIISPILMEPGRVRAEYFRKLASQDIEVPGKGLCRIKAATIKSWYYQYSKNGIKGLEGKKRSDLGQRRFSLTDEGFEKIGALRKTHQFLTVAQFYRLCLGEGLLGAPPMHETTLRRFLKNLGLHKVNEVQKSRKRFEMEKFGDLWVGDFMHGPSVLRPGQKRRKKAILLAIVDDHTRYIVGAGFHFLENTQAVELVFKQALLTHGIPSRIYLDNGPAFSSKYLLKVCARLAVSLVHSKPYDSPSRGKIERFFRTVRDKFLSQLGPDPLFMDLKQLNDRFDSWLRKDYLEFYHKGIGTTPLERYLKSIQAHSLKRVDECFLDECFLEEAQRKVNKDATISLNKVIYEVPPSYIGSFILLKWPLGRPDEVYLYEGEHRKVRITPVDAQFNGKYRPTPRISDVSLQKKKED